MIYVIEGKQGSGKTRFADKFAKMLAGDAAKVYPSGKTLNPYRKNDVREIKTPDTVEGLYYITEENEVLVALIDDFDELRHPERAIRYLQLAEIAKNAHIVLCTSENRRPLFRGQKASFLRVDFEGENYPE